MQKVRKPMLNKKSDVAYRRNLSTQKSTSSV
jgi:hypothetical protein